MAVTTSRLPNREIFLKWDDFCLVVVKLTKTCKGFKRPQMDNSYPHMCSHLLTLMEEFDNVNNVNKAQWICQRIRGTQNTNTTVSDC